MSRLLKALSLALGVFILVCSPLLAYLYRAEVAIVGDNVSSYPMLPVLWPSNNEWMADNGFMNSSANDTRVQTFAGLNQPHMVVDDKTLTAIPIVPLTQTNLYFLTGESELSAMDIIVGYDGYITITDNATLELGDNFTVVQSGWVDTSNVGAYLVSKDEAFATVISGASNITSAIGTGWVSPTSFSDATGNWSNETNAYDGNQATYAQEPIIALSWGDWLVLINTPVPTNKIRFDARYNVAKYDQVDIDAYYNGTWNDVYTGNFTNHAWDEKDLGGLYTVNATRFRFHNAGAVTEYPWLYEVALYSYDVTVTASGVSSGGHTVNTTTTEATMLTGNVLNFAASGTSYIDSGISYNASAKFWVSMWVRFDETFTSGSGSLYALGKYASANDYFQIRFERGFRALTSKLYIGGVEKFSISSGDLGPVAPDVWHHILVSISSVNGVRLRWDNGAAITDADTTALPNGGNITIGNYYAGFASGFDGEIAHVIVGTDDLSVAEETALYNGVYPSDATDYWYIDEGSGTNIISYGSLGNNGIAGAGTTWQTSDRMFAEPFIISIDETVEDYAERHGVDVPDNSNSWTLEGGSLPYREYYSHTVDTIEVIRYEPASMIIGTTLPNELSPGDNDGTIIWGSNPAGVTANMSSLVSSGQPSIVVSIEDASRDILPIVEVSDWWGDGSVTKAATLANPIRPFITMVSDNTTLNEIQVWRWMGLALLFFAVVASGRVLRGHQGITAIIAGVALGGLVGFDSNIFPMWMLVITIGCLIGGVVAERSPVL